MKKLISLFLSLILVFSLGGVYIVNADTNIAYVSEDGVINGFSGTVYTDVETAISNLGLNGGTIYVEGNIVLPTIPDVQSMIGKEIIFCGYNNLAEGNVVEFTNKTSSFVPNAEVDIIFDNITIKHQDGSTTEDWITPNGGSITFGPNCLYEHGYRQDRDQNLKLYIGSYYTAKGGTMHFNAPNVEYAEVGSLAGWIQGEDSSFTVAGDFIYNFNAGQFDNIYGGMRNTTTGFATLNGDVYYNFNGATLAAGSALVAGNVSNGVINGNIFFTINGGNINRTLKLGTANSSDATKTSIGNMVLMIQSDKIKESGDSIVLNIIDGSIPEKIGKRFLIINHKDDLDSNELATVTTSSETLDYNLAVTGGELIPEFEKSTDGTVGAFLGFKANADTEGHVPTIDSVMLEQNANGYYIINEAANVQNISFVSKDELVSKVTLKAGDVDERDIIHECSTGTEFVVPACPFTPPENMVFSGWSCGNDIYHTGDKIEITDNVTLIASYVSKDSAQYFYVSETGSDENSGLTSNEAFATIGRAVLAATNSKCKSAEIYINGSVEYENVSTHTKKITYREGSFNGDIMLAGNTSFANVTIAGNIYTNGYLAEFSPNVSLSEGCVLTLGTQGGRTSHNTAILRGGIFTSIILCDADDTFIDICGASIDELTLGAENTVCNNLTVKLFSGNMKEIVPGAMPASGNVFVYTDEIYVPFDETDFKNGTFTLIKNKTDMVFDVTSDGIINVPDGKYVYAKGDIDYFYSVSGKLEARNGIYELYEAKGAGVDYIPYPKSEVVYFESWTVNKEGHLTALFTTEKMIHPYYVSENGDDDNAGVSTVSPFQTLTAAIAAIDGDDGKIVIMDTVYWNESVSVCNVPTYEGTITFEGLSEESVDTQIIDYSRSTDINANTAGLHLHGNSIFKNISFRAHHWKTFYTSGYDARFEGKIGYIPGVVGNSAFTITVGKYNASTEHTSLYLGAECNVASILIGHNKASSVSGMTRLTIDGANVGSVKVCGEGATLNDVDIIFVKGSLSKVVSDDTYTTSKISGDLRFIKSDGLTVDFDNKASIELGGDIRTFSCEEGVRLSLLDGENMYDVISDNTVRAENCSDGSVYYSSKGGTIGLPIGSYNLTISDTDYYKNDGNTITVLTDTEIVFDEYLYHCTPKNETLAFTGWKYKNSDDGPASEELLSSGTVLEATFEEYNPAGTELGIFRRQIRTEIEDALGLRFIVNKENSLDEKFNITECGAVIIPKEILGSQELVKDGRYTYNEKIYSSSSVSAKNIFKTTDTGLWYTLCLVGIQPKNYSRLYSARAYASYETVNGESYTLYSDTCYSSLVNEAKNNIFNNEDDDAMFKKIIETWEESYFGAGVTPFASNHYDTAYTVNSSGVNVREITIDSGLGGRDVRVSMITDSHLDPKHPAYASALIKAMECANFADQIVLCGDNVESVTSAASMAQLQQIVWDKYPETIVALGNHEYFYPDTYTTFDDIKFKVDQAWAHDPDYYSKLIGDKVLVVAADDARQPVFQESRYYFTDEKCDKLEEDIKLAREKGYVILFFHHVSITKLDRTYMANGRMYDLVTQNADVIKACFSGHDHQDYYQELNGTYIDVSGKMVNTVIPCYWLESCHEENNQGNVLYINVK